MGRSLRVMKCGFSTLEPLPCDRRTLVSKKSVILYQLCALFVWKALTANCGMNSLERLEGFDMQFGGCCVSCLAAHCLVGIMPK